MDASGLCADTVVVAGGEVLLADGRVAPRDIRIVGSLIADISEPGRNRVEPGARTVDAAGRLVLPGIVDIHGDAFERQIMPRPGVGFDLAVALIDSDSQLVANGITTAYHGVTLSWEPGLRSGASFARFLDALEDVRGALRCDTRVHMRFETYNVDAADDAEAWIRAGRVGLLAFNDHTPDIHAKRGDHAAMSKYAERAGMAVPDFVALLDRIAARGTEVPAALTRLAAAAKGVGIPQLSHDDRTADDCRRYLALGCTISEFPETAEAASEARRLGNPVVMGAPNVVRGGSHTGAASATDMIARGMCTVLASDYYSPAPLLAALKLHRKLGFGLGDASSLVSRAPALAAGLDDRGEIAPGRRADLIVVDRGLCGVPRVSATLVAGRPVYRA
jgi:alpha-D-ribose 1-methylphosphonate 5-triphosphate diphosphatase